MPAQSLPDQGRARVNRAADTATAWELRILQQIVPYASRRDLPHQIDLRFTIHEGRQQFVRAVLISGNRVTRTTLINRQVTLGPGDPLSPREMTDIQRRLYDRPPLDVPLQYRA